MKRMRGTILTLALAVLAMLPPATPRAAARGPSLQVAAPAQVAAGAQFELALSLQDADNLGGYEAALRFDTAAAHFNGMDQPLDALRRIGRDAGPLGPVEQPDGIMFGAYSCPVAQCAGARQGPRQDRGASGTVPLATIDIIADRPGVLELAVDAASFVDAAGAPLAVAGGRQLVQVVVGAPGGGPRFAAPAGGAGPARGPIGSPGPLDLTRDGLITHADLMEVALAWTMDRETGEPCGQAAGPTRDVNHDGCVDIADAQLVAAGYSPSSPPAGPSVAGADVAFTVNAMADDADAQPGDGICAASGGACTLRAAIEEANLAAGPNTIAFAIPGAGVHTIMLATPLPTLSDESGPTTIDGYTQPGARPNDDARVSNAAIQVQLTVTNVITPATIEALHITSAGNTIRGLAIFAFRRSIFVFGPAAKNNLIAGNFIGTDAAGSYVAPAIADSGNGVELSQGAAYNHIGGGTPAERNVISGNPKNGIATFNGGTDHNVVAGNLMGLTPDGRGRLHNLSHGVDINNHSSSNVVGGGTPAERNVISGNDAEGVEISHGQQTAGNQVIGNFIGTDVTGTRSSAGTRNGWHGVHVEDGPVNSLVTNNVIGNNGLGGVSIDGYETGAYPLANQVTNNRIGVSLDGTPVPNGHFGVQVADHSSQSKIGPGNMIAYNPIGVQIVGVDSDFNTITQNAIFGNTGLGIDIEPVGAANPNDPGDADTGANEQLNFPVLASATQYEVRGTACVTCTVEIFVADKGAGAYGQGKTFAGSAKVYSDGTFVVKVSDVAVGSYVTATATDALGNTSEFALNLRAVASAPPPPPVYLPLVAQ